MPGDSLCLLNLYKVLPIKKAENYKLLDYDPRTFSFGPKYQRNIFQKIDYGKFYSYNNFATVMQDLSNISDNIETAPMKSYFKRLFYYVKSYFWEFKKKINNNPIDDLFETFIYELFNSDLTYPEFLEEISRRKELLKRYAEMQTGLAVSTLHGLKGLEFDNVIIINMDDDLFPNFSLIDSKEYPKKTNLSLKEAERRLFYVAITRARDNLTIYYNEENPSIFMKDVRIGMESDNSDLAKSTGEVDASIQAKNSRKGVAVKVDSPLAEMDLFSKDEAETKDIIVSLPTDENTQTDSSIANVTHNQSTSEEVADSTLAKTEQQFDFDEDDDDVTFYLDDDGNFKMNGVLNNLTSNHATNEIENAKTNRDYKEEIEEEIKDVTNVQLGETMQEITKQVSVPATDLPKMHLENLNKDKKKFKSSDSYISRLFGDYNNE